MPDAPPFRPGTPTEPGTYLWRSDFHPEPIRVRIERRDGGLWLIGRYGSQRLDGMVRMACGEMWAGPLVAEAPTPER
jgi:hypothetical protein